MTGQRRSPEELRKKLSQLIRYEMESMPTAAFGRIKSLDEDSRRADIETAPDGSTLTNVAIAEPFASDGAGDLRPLNPELHDGPVGGLVLFFHHPVEDQLSGGNVQQGEWSHEEEDAIFLPAQVWFDSDTVPDHTGDERRIDHHTGGHIQIDTETTILAHQLGAVCELVGDEGLQFEDDNEFGPQTDQTYAEHIAESWGEEFVPEIDNTEWPIDEGAEVEETQVAARLRHPDGPGVTAVDRGVALEGSHRVDAGKFTNGERQPLAGPYQHMHLMDHGDGEVSMVGPQLTFREFIAWMVDDEQFGKIRNQRQVLEAREYALAYHSWLEAEVGREIDPADPDDWPDPEPMPTVPEQQAWEGLEISLSTGVTVPPADPIGIGGVVPRVGGTFLHEALVRPDTAAISIDSPPAYTDADIIRSNTVSAGTATSDVVAYGAGASGDVVETITWVDDFSHQDPAAYYNNGSDANITTAWGEQSPYSMEATNSGINEFRSHSSSSWRDHSSTLDYYPQEGDTIHVRFRMDSSHGGGYEGGDDILFFRWGVATNQFSQGMKVEFHGGLTGPPVYLVADGGDNVDDGTVGSYSAGTVFEWVIDWTGGTTTAELIEVSSGQTRVTLSGNVGSTSANGIGFRFDGSPSPAVRVDGVWVE